MLDKGLYTLWCALPDQNDIIDVAPIIYDMGGKRVVMWDVLEFLVAHSQVGVAWGKIGTHGSALSL